MLCYTHIVCLGIYNIQENEFLLRRDHSNTATKLSLRVFTLNVMAVGSDKAQTSTHFLKEMQVL
jgi:hypothetical protein